MKKLFLLLLFVLCFAKLAEGAEDPGYLLRTNINQIIQDATDAGRDPVSDIAAYLSAEDEKYMITSHPHNATVAGSYQQIVLLRTQSILTIYTITDLDSAVTFTPAFTTSLYQFFDALIYSGSFRSLLDTATHTAPDSVLIGCTVDGTTNDSAAVTILGTYDQYTTPVLVYTCITKGATFIQRGMT